MPCPAMEENLAQEDAFLAELPPGEINLDLGTKINKTNNSSNQSCAREWCIPVNVVYQLSTQTAET